MSEITVFGIRVNSPFTGALKEKLEEAAKVYLESPVQVTLPIVLLNPTDPTFEIVKDEITVAIVDVNHKSDDGSIVVVRAKVTNGSKEIKTVPVPSNGNSDTEVEILCDGDDLTMIVDTIYGDASIIRVSDADEKVVDLDDLSTILCRLALPVGLPVSSGEPVTWEDFVSGQSHEEGGGDE